jgi:hypothetical protein
LGLNKNKAAKSNIYAYSKLMIKNMVAVYMESKKMSSGVKIFNAKQYGVVKSVDRMERLKYRGIRELILDCTGMKI